MSGSGSPAGQTTEDALVFSEGSEVGSNESEPVIVDQFLALGKHLSDTLATHNEGLIIPAACDFSDHLSRKHTGAAFRCSATEIDLLKNLHGRFGMWMAETDTLLSSVIIEEDGLDPEDTESLLFGNKFPSALHLCYFILLQLAWHLSGYQKGDRLWQIIEKDLEWDTDLVLDSANLHEDPMRANRDMDATEFFRRIHIATFGLAAHDPKLMRISIMVEMWISQDVFGNPSPESTERSRQLSCIPRLMWWRVCILKGVAYHASLVRGGFMTPRDPHLQEKVRLSRNGVLKMRERIKDYATNNQISPAEQQMMNENLFDVAVLYGETEWNIDTNPWQVPMSVLLVFTKTTHSPHVLLVTLFAALGPKTILEFNATHFEDITNDTKIEAHPKLMSILKIITMVYVLNAIARTECRYPNFLSDFVHKNPTPEVISTLKFGIAMINRHIFIIMDYQLRDTHNDVDAFLFLLANALCSSDSLWSRKMLAFFAK